MNLVQVISIALFCIAYCIYLPISVYSIHKFVQYKKNDIIQKRSGTITLCIFSMGIMLGEPTRALVKGFNQTWEWWFYHPINICIIMVGFVFSLKVFLNYFDIHYSKVMLQSKWKQILNPTAETSNWFIVHKSDYSRYSYWKKHLSVVFIVAVVSLYIWEIIFPNNQTTKTNFGLLTSVLFTIIPISLLSYIRYKTPRFEDRFGIRDEIRYILYPGIFLMVFLVIYIGTNEIVYFRLIKSLLFSTFSAWVIYVITLWVIRQNKHYLRENLEFHISKNTEMQSLGSVTLEMVLSTEQGFEQLMNHLSEEFSTETLLCICECIQFQKVLYQYCLGCVSIDHWINISDSVPQSQIVLSNVPFENDNDDNKIVAFMTIAHKLYLKYIKVSCALEININHQLRETFTETMDNLDVWINSWNNNLQPSNVNKWQTLFEYFTPIIEELTFLLGSSFYRFKSSPRYRLLDVYNDK